MSSGVSDTGAALWLPAMFGIGTVPVHYYIGLTVGEPRANMSGTTVTTIEPSGGAYARQLYAAGATAWDADGGTVANSTAIAFPTPTADWGRVTHFVLCSTVTVGDLYAWGELRNPQNILEGIAPTMPAGSLVVSMPTGS